MTRRPAAIDPAERREVSKALKATIGFDPFRILDNALPGNEDAEFQLRSMVAGIDTLATLRAWKAAERRLGRGPDSGPREGVLRVLEQREEFLEEYGERPDLLATEPEERPERFRPREEPRDIPEKEFFWTVQDGERRPWEERPTRAKVTRSRSNAGDQAVVTDGGEQS